MTESAKEKKENTAKPEEDVSQESHHLVEAENAEVEEIIEELEKRPREEQKELISNLIRVERNVYSGPIPPPELLRGYEEILPGTADRIIAMAEKQADHRRNLEKSVVESGARDSRLGIICGTIVCVVVCITGLLLSLITDAAALGALLSLSGMASLVGVFIHGTKSNSNERIKKDSQKKDDKPTS